MSKRRGRRVAPRAKGVAGRRLDLDRFGEGAVGTPMAMGFSCIFRPNVSRSVWG